MNMSLPVSLVGGVSRELVWVCDSLLSKPLPEDVELRPWLLMRCLRLSLVRLLVLLLWVLLLLPWLLTSEGVEDHAHNDGACDSPAYHCDELLHFY